MVYRTKGKEKERGSILLLAFFFLIVLFALSTAFYRIIPAEFHSANHSRQKTEALFAADSGARAAVAWLRFQQMNNVPVGIIQREQIEEYNVEHFGTHEDDYDVDDWPTLAADDSKLLAQRIDDKWSYLSRIRMDDTDFFLRIYTVESCAYFMGKPRTAVKIVVQNQNFAEYALYISDWDSNFIYSMSPNGIQGPVHTNGFPRVAAGDSSFWTATKDDGSPEDAWVSGPLAKITHASRFRADSTSPDNTLDMDVDGLQYANGNSFSSDLDLVPFSESGSPNSERYQKIVDGGRENIRQVQEVPLPNDSDELRIKAWGGNPPENNADWNAASNGASIMVNTDTGIANDHEGKVAGGIFIRGGGNASDVLLDLTPEGHQKIRVRQGYSSVSDPSLTTYRAQVPRYQKEIVHPAYDEPTEVCVEERTRQVPNYVSRRVEEEVTQANASRCGTETVYVPGEGGISEPIQVAKTCTYTVTRWVTEQDGTRDETYCYRRGPGDPIHHPERREWVNSDESDPEAVQRGTRTITVDDPENYDDVTEVPGYRNIQNWNSVVEVNDANYQIPYYPGMKINGEEITNPADPRLTVPDGNTVTIKHDVVEGGRDYAEYTIMEGRTNGVVFSDEHLYGVRGTNKGAKYEDPNGNLKYQGRVLATNISSNKKIEIRDSILQYYDGDLTDDNGNNLNDGRDRLVAGNHSPDEKHILGLLAESIDIKPTGRSHNYENTDTDWRENGNVQGRSFLGGRFNGGINVYAVLMAGRTETSGNVRGGFGSHNNAMNNDDNLGDFNLYGGIISGNARKTQQQGGGDNNGFRLSLNYDKVAASFLSYFPVTPQFDALRYVTYTVGTEYHR